MKVAYENDLEHEGRRVGLDVVVGADAGEDLVADAEGGVLRRHERADLRHDLQQRDLTQVRRLAALRGVTVDDVTHKCILPSAIHTLMRTENAQHLHCAYTVTSKL